MKQLELSTLSILIAVSEKGSFSKAALKVHLSVGSVSKRITDLEASIGTALFYRHARGVRLTPAGYSMIQHARGILYGVDRMHSEISEFSQEIKWYVRIAATTTVVTNYLPRDLHQYLEDNPAVQIDLSEQLSENIVDSLQQGSIDFGIFSKSVQHHEIETRPYRTEQFCLITLADHPLAKRESIKFSEALDNDFVGLSHSSSAFDFVRLKAESKLRLRIKVRNFDAICRVVKLGLGVGVLPISMANLHTKDGTLKAIPLEDKWAKRELVLGTKSLKAFTIGVRGIFQHLEQVGATPIKDEMCLKSAPAAWVNAQMKSQRCQTAGVKSVK